MLLLGAMAASNAWIVARASEDAPAAATPPLASYRDPVAGFAIDHPVGWRAEPIGGGVLFRLGGRDAVSVKRTTLARPVNGTNVADMRAVTDAVLTAPEAGLNVVAAKPTTLGGLPGMHYLYTFSAKGLRGAHTHWFAFSGTTMYTVVFQALPDTRLAALAPTFDAVAASFRVLDAR
ncbi:MAG: hypothetical protein ACT4QF_11210 [Sporichthyaceae bacterium]